ncbi:hypothetical protein F971_00216 [Acinetobacter vivianii]|uniref:Uncharacterized protein n=1 Tax=Acinetobacter vivianii TaxID=1776742 RepID=N8WGE0_9GAMM|nr:hypothetical protein F971_00216 [Acinetobacter vivianii]
MFVLCMVQQGKRNLDSITQRDRYCGTGSFFYDSK